MKLKVKERQTCRKLVNEKIAREGRTDNTISLGCIKNKRLEKRKQVI